MTHQRRSSRVIHNKRTSIDLSSVLATPINSRDILEQVPPSVRKLALANSTSPSASSSNPCLYVSSENTPDRLAELLERSASLHGGPQNSGSMGFTLGLNLGLIQSPSPTSPKVKKISTNIDMLHPNIKDYPTPPSSTTSSTSDRPPKRQHFQMQNQIQSQFSPLPKVPEFPKTSRPISNHNNHNRRSSVVVQVKQENQDASTRILDVSGFPSSFKTVDVRNLFASYITQMGGFKIKWLNDQRALVIFEHPITARKAYLENLSRSDDIKIKPYEDSMENIRLNTNHHNHNHNRHHSMSTLDNSFSLSSSNFGNRRISRDLTSRGKNNSPSFASIAIAE